MVSGTLGALMLSALGVVYGDIGTARAGIGACQRD
jgi:K+ transporter